MRSFGISVKVLIAWNHRKLPLVVETWERVLCVWWSLSIFWGFHEATLENCCLKGCYGERGECESSSLI
jgi:hypothetical protein